MYRLLLIKLILFLNFTAKSQDCNCNREEGISFIHVSKNSDLIIEARILEYPGFDSLKSIEPREMKVEIIERLKGESGSRQVTVLGSAFNDCYDWLYQYKIGKTYI